MENRQDLHTLTAELVTAQDQLLALYELSMAMRRQTSIDMALEQLAKLTCRTMQAEQCFIQLEAPGRKVINVQFPDREVKLEETGDRLVQDVSFERWVIRDSNEQKEGVLLLPLIVEEKIAGFVICIRANGTPFGSPEGKLGQALANQAAAFLENMILSEVRIENAALQTELRIASEVQTGLLPEVLPTVKCIDLWGSSQPAKQVGGDFFDVQARADGTVFFCVGDVSGKGMPAALLMAMLLMILRGEQRRGSHLGPAVLMEHLYRAAYDELTSSGMFATLFLGVFDPKNRTLNYANAGHSPVIIRPKDGSARLLEAGSVPVGIFPEASVEEKELVMNPGDLLVVASDGLNEARNTDGDFFSIERLLYNVDKSAEQSAAEIGHLLLAAVSEFGVGNPQSDDQTCVVVKGIN